MTVKRHYFPGNNTSLGFFSYYDDIMADNNKVYILKGGPGTGKSTIMRRLAERAEQKGIDVDYLHCSGDANSLDGVYIPSKKILMVDGTAPHTLDPAVPGGVETIINLGQFWNETNLMGKKAEIIKSDNNIKEAYRNAYSIFAAAGSIYDIMDAAYHKQFIDTEVVSLAEDICKKEMGHYSVSAKAGKRIRGFACGLTHDGVINYVKSLMQNIGKIYIIESPCGFDNSAFFDEIIHQAIKKGFDCQVYYCPMKPDKKIEHLIIPELDIAFTTVNKIHEISPWELYKDENDNKKISVICLKDYIIGFDDIEEDIYEMQVLSKSLLSKGIKFLKTAKFNHDKMEEIYINEMNFEKSNKFIEMLIENIV